MSATPLRSNLGPLTTTFTPPATCSVLGINSFPPTVAYQAQHCFTTTSVPGTTIQFTDNSGSKTSIAVSATVTSIIYSGGVADDITCRPSTTYRNPADAGGYGFYSPGLICPSGWHKACTAELDTNGSPVPISGTHTSFPFEYALMPGETAIGCCPHSYYCANNPQTCESLVTSGVVKATSCIDTTHTSTFDLTVPISTGTQTVRTVMAYAPLIQLVWQSTDIKSIVTVTTSPDGSLDTGDKAAIGVGVIALILLGVAIVLGIFLLRRRRSSRAWTPTEPPHHPETSPDYPGRPKDGRTAAEAEGVPLTELPDPQTDFNRSRW